METISKRNNSTDIFRYICALLVLSIHTDFLSEYSASLSFFITQILARIAVPFFFSVSGYFFISKLEQGKECALRQFVKHILIPYLFWSTIYMLMGAASTIINKSSLSAFFVKFIFDFFFNGSVDTLWFIPALIYSAIFTTILYKIGQKKTLLPIAIALYLIGCLGVSYYSIGIHIPVLQNLYQLECFDTIRHIFFMGIPFFAAGILVRRIIEGLLTTKSSTKALWLVFVVGLLLFFGEILLVRKLALEKGITITLFLFPLIICILLLLLKYPLDRWNKLGWYGNKLASFTYYSHPLFINILLFLGPKIVSGGGIPPTGRFAITWLGTLLTGLLIIHINNKRLNRLVGA